MKKWRIIVKHYTNICHTDAIPLAAEGWYHLIEGGTNAGVPMVCWEHRAFVAYVPGEKNPVGILTYSVIDAYQQYTVAIGYVKRKYRRRGVYKALWKALAKLAKNTAGIALISSSTSVNNKAMRAHAKATGREECSVGLNYYV